MQIINIHDAKTNFSRYIKKVVAGEEVIICSAANKPIAKLIPYNVSYEARVPGQLKGKIKIEKECNVLPEEFLKFFNN